MSIRVGVVVLICFIVYKAAHFGYEIIYGGFSIFDFGREALNGVKDYLVYLRGVLAPPEAPTPIEKGPFIDDRLLRFVK